MATELNRDELELLLGAYALDALDDAEREAVDRYLERNPEASDEVAAYREMVGWLVEPVGQSPELWNGIRDALDPPPARRTESDRVVPLRRPSPTRRWLAAAAAVVILAGIGVGIAALADRGNGNDVAAAADAARENGARATLVKSSDGTQHVQVVYGKDGRGYVVDPHLRTLPQGRTYQLWALVGDKSAPAPVSAGVLGRDARPSAFQFSGPVVGFAISLEDAPGATLPSRADQLQGRFA